jgi:catechol 2,3-dioxygenase-like lactoylglutathione lyase family enzyme
MQESRVILKRIAHVHYSHVDVDKTRQFLRDFGLTEVARVGDQYYWKGYGDLPFIYVLEKATEGKALFKGVAFEAESKEELEKAAGLKVGSHNL